MALAAFKANLNLARDASGDFGASGLGGTASPLAAATTANTAVLLVDTDVDAAVTSATTADTATGTAQTNVGTVDTDVDTDVTNATTADTDVGTVVTDLTTAFTAYDAAAASIIAITGDTYSNVTHQFTTGGATGLTHAQWATQAALLNTAATDFVTAQTDNTTAKTATAAAKTSALATQTASDTAVAAVATAKTDTAAALVAITTTQTDSDAAVTAMAAAKSGSIDTSGDVTIVVNLSNVTTMSQLKSVVSKILRVAEVSGNFKA